MEQHNIDVSQKHYVECAKRVFTFYGVLEDAKLVYCDGNVNSACLFGCWEIEQKQPKGIFLGNRNVPYLVKSVGHTDR